MVRPVTHLMQRRFHHLCREFSSSSAPTRDLLHLPLCPVLSLSKKGPTHDWEAIFAEQKPLVLKGFATSWPATSTWDHSPDYLINKCGHVEVPVEVGGDYMNPKTKHTRIPFAKAISKLASLEKQQQNKVGSRGGGQVHYYVAQHSLRAFPGLIDDLHIPEMCTSTGSGGGVQRSALWMGSAHSSSPCHFDPFHNILVQIYGSKSVCLFDPEVSSHMYPCAPPQANTSAIAFNKLSNSFQTYRDDSDCRTGLNLRLPKEYNNIDDFEYPLLSSISSQYCFHAELEKGDALFIPFKWWHFCKALSRNCSVNFWWL